MSCWAGGLASRATARTLSDSDQELVGCRPAGGVAEQLGLPAWGWLAAAVGLAFWLRGPLAAMVDGPTVATWTTVFVSFSVRALPFLVLGVVVSGAVAALVPPGWLARALPRTGRWWRCRRPGWPGSPGPAVSAGRCRSPAGSRLGGAAGRGHAVSPEHTRSRPIPRPGQGAGGLTGVRAELGRSVLRCTRRRVAIGLCWPWSG
jgi:hypothetical protein